MDEKKELESLEEDPKDNLDEIALESSLIVLLSSIQNIHQFRSISNTIDIVSFTLSQANNIRGELKYNSSNNDNVNQDILKDFSISAVNLAANKYLQNNAHKIALSVAGDVSENYATNYAVEEAMKMANNAVVLAKKKKGNKVTADLLRRTYQNSFSKWFKIFKQRAINGPGKQLGKNAGKMATKSTKFIPIYAIYKLFDGSSTYLTVNHDKEDFIKQFDEDNGLSEIEKRYAEVTLKDKKNDDLSKYVGNNAFAILIDCLTIGFGGDTGRYVANYSDAKRAKHRLEMDDKYFMKDTTYTNERVAGIAFSNSKKSMALKASLSRMEEEMEKFKNETNISDELYYDISAIISTNTDIGDYDKQVNRLKYLKFLMKKHPNEDPRELIKIVLGSEHEIYKWFQSKTPEEIIEDNLSSYYDKKRKKEIDTLIMLKQEFPNIPEHILKEKLLDNQEEIDRRIFVEEDKIIEKEYPNNLSYKVDIKPKYTIQKSKTDNEIIKEVVKVAIENDPMKDLYVNNGNSKVKTLHSDVVIDGVRDVSDKLDFYFEQFIDSFTNGIKKSKLAQ